MFVPCILLLFFNLFIMMYYILWVCYCFRKWICLYLVYFFCSLIFFCSSWWIIASGSRCVCTLFYFFFSLICSSWCIIASGSRCVFTLFYFFFSLYVHHDVLSRQEVDVFVPCVTSSFLLFVHLEILFPFGCFSSVIRYVVPV